MLRMNGGTLQIPILHGLLPESPQAAHLEGWRIGQAARMTANIPQTVSLLKYFYESNIKFTAQKRVYYEVTGPKIRVKFTDNKKEVYYHIPYLLQRIKETFHFKESEMKNIQIAPQDYFVNIEAVPKNDVHFNVLDVNNPTIIYKTKTVQFYGA